MTKPAKIAVLPGPRGGLYVSWDSLARILYPSTNLQWVARAKAKILYYRFTDSAPGADDLVDLVLLRDGLRSKPGSCWVRLRASRTAKRLTRAIDKYRRILYNRPSR